MHSRHAPLVRAVSGTGVRTRIAVLALVAGTCAAMAAFIPGGAQAAPSGAAAAQAANVQISAAGNVLPILAQLDASLATPLVAAPDAAGTNTSTVGLGVDAASLAQVGLGAVSATSTRTATQTEGTSQVAGASVSLLGTTVLQTGVIASTSTCPAGGTPAATATAASLTVGGTTLSADAGATADVGVTVAGLTDATVAVTVASPHSATATSATASGLQVDLTLQARVLTDLTAIDLPLGSVTLAASSCTAPAAVAAAPTLTALSPTTGPTAGGQTVRLTGSGFTAGTTVSFGGTAATDVTVASPTSLTATTPAHAAGPVDVDVTTAAGTAGPETYTYVAPTISGISPSSGPTAGGQTVTISGSGFDPGTTVSIGGTPATGVSVNDAGTAITATTPAGPAGPADVAVSGGGETETLPGGYDYVTGAATSIDPASGPTAGGQKVTIDGSGFGPGATVTIGGNPATDVSVDDAGTAITATTPPGAAGPADVAVTDGGTTSTLPGAYTYVAPSVTSVDPSEGPTAGGQKITVAGAGFGPGSTVTVGSNLATDVSVNDAGTAITATTPAGAAGTVDVSVDQPDAPTATLAQAYTYEAPAVTSIDPTRGPTSGGQSVTISGSGFEAGSTVDIGGHAATHVSVNAAGTAITVTTPAGAAGPADVVVTDGASTLTLPQAYTYVPPAVTSVEPAQGPTAGGQQVTIDGSGFGSGSTVTIGGKPATGVAVGGDGTTITATTPAGDTGPVDVAVTDGGTTATLPDGYTYDAPPTVGGISPATGPTTGGATVTITGDGFVDGGTTVRFGNKLASKVTVVSGNEITAVSPAGSGDEHVVVTTPGGSSTSPTMFAYVLGEKLTKSNGSSELPFTGSDSLELIGVGGWFVAAGGWSYLYGARKRRRS